MNVCGARTALRTFYDGPREKSNRTRGAYFGLKNLQYREEGTFTLSSFVTKYTGYFDTLWDGSKTKMETEEICWLKTHVTPKIDVVKTVLEV